MRNWFRPTLICAAVLTAASAAAYAAPSPTQVALTTGSDPQTAALGFVQSYPAATEKLQQIARWSDAICVEVSGLSADKAKVVQARVEEVAQAVGVKAQPAGCRHNIEIVFTTKPQAFLDDIAAHQEVLLGYDHVHAKTVKTVTHPIQAWYKTATRARGDMGALFAADLKDRDGNRVNPSDFFPSTGSFETVDTPENPGPVGCAGSLITDCTRTLFKNVLVVVDSRAAAGKTLGTLADYVAMMALSQAKSLDGCAALPSVMDLMAKAPCPGRDPPNGLTDTDIAFLTGLYFSDPETKAVQQQVEIAARMTRLLIKAGATTASK